MTQINHEFRDFVTSSVFHLHLSNNMISFLAYVFERYKACNGSIKYEDQEDFVRFIGAGGRSDHATPARALFRRGLIYSPIPDWPGIYHPTEAGKHVFELLKIAGLIESVQSSALEAINDGNI